MIVLPAHNASEWTGPTGNNTYLLTGRTPTLIDAGVGKGEHISSLQTELGGAALQHVLVTHWHSDHMGGVLPLASVWPQLRVSKLPPGMPCGVKPLADGERIEAGDDTLLVIATPGHAPDHCCLLDERLGDLFCGDLVRSGGTIVIAARRGGDLAEYLESLRRVRDLRPRRLLPGHGPIIEDPVGIIDAYIRHRLEREAQVLAALRGAPRTIEELVQIIYPTLAQPLVVAASETMLAHLVKLAKEGRARQEEGVWRS